MVEMEIGEIWNMQRIQHAAADLEDKGAPCKTGESPAGSGSNTHPAAVKGMETATLQP